MKDYRQRRLVSAAYVQNLLYRGPSIPSGSWQATGFKNRLRIWLAGVFHPLRERIKLVEEVRSLYIHEFDEDSRLMIVGTKETEVSLR